MLEKILSGEKLNKKQIELVKEFFKNIPHKQNEKTN